MKNITLLLVLFCLFTSLIFPQKEISKQYHFKDVSSLNLENYKGHIQVEAWNMPGAEISVRIYCEDGDDDCEKKVRNTRIRVDSSSADLKIETDYSNIKNNDSWLNIGNWFGSEVLPYVDYTIKLPANARLIIDDYKSDINVTNLKSQMKIETYKGRVKAKGITGPLSFESYKGNSEFYFTKLTGKNSFDTYKGNIVLYVPEDTRAALEEDFTKKTDFDSDIAFTEEEASSGKIRFESYKGSMKIKKSRQ